MYFNTRFQSLLPCRCQQTARPIFSGITEFRNNNCVGKPVHYYQYAMPAKMTWMQGQRTSAIGVNVLQPPMESIAARCTTYPAEQHNHQTTSNQKRHFVLTVLMLCKWTSADYTPWQRLTCTVTSLHAKPDLPCI